MAPGGTKLPIFKQSPNILSYIVFEISAIIRTDRLG